MFSSKEDPENRFEASCLWELYFKLFTLLSPSPRIPKEISGEGGGDKNYLFSEWDFYLQGQ